MYTLALVDDEAYILEMLQEVFPWAEMGFAIKAACTNGQSLLAFLENNRVDVLLTDIVLGGENGLDVCAAARKLQPDLLVVILSAHSDFEYARTAMRLNIFDYLLKPITFEGVTTCFTAVKDKLDILHNPDKPEDTNYRVNLIKSYVDKHCGEDISLESMAALLAMNPAYFNRFFKRHEGIAFSDYLAKRRMERAIDLLKDPRNKIFEICMQVGYYGKQSFYKQFRKHTGRTPVQYRDEVLKIKETDDA